MIMLPRAILFDLDDTIIASGQRPLVLQEVAEGFADELAPIRPADIAEILEAAFAIYWSDPDRHKAARFGIAAARRQIVADAFATQGAPNLTEDLAFRFADRFTEIREQMTVFYPGARETIEALKAKGVKLALVTNGSAPTQRAKVERFDLAPLFDHIQIEGEAGFGKPETRAYLHAMEALGVGPQDTWMVGDNLEWEVAAPQRLGIYSIWHDPLGRGLPLGSDIRPDRIVRLLSELLSVDEAPATSATLPSA
jgi:putative hydrolase of the HAD superfamily